MQQEQVELFANPPENKPEVPTTEVTTIAKEEAKTGQTILPKMTEEEFVARASVSFFKNRKNFANIFDELSARGKTRVMSAVLDIPAEGMPVFLKSDNEKMAYSLGQQVQQSRFIMIQHQVGQEIKRRKAELEAQQTTQETKTDG